MHMKNESPGALALPNEPLSLVSLDVVCGVTGTKKTFVYDAVREGRMPRPLRLSSRCSRWRAGDIREYLRDPLNWSSGKAIDAHMVAV
jgi:predicted DNA-binding transcriptional regulator AlpA